MKATGRRITCDGSGGRGTVSSMRHFVVEVRKTPVRLCADPTDV